MHARLVYSICSIIVLNGCICAVSGKTSWPELVGWPADEAVATVERENPSVQATIVAPGDVPAVPVVDLCSTVLVFVDEAFRVARPIVFSPPRN